MKVICRNTIGNYPVLVLPVYVNEPITESNYIADKAYYTIDAERMGFSITEKRLYEAFGVMFYLNRVYYLLQDDKGVPGFLPSDLFDVVDNNVFFDWEIASYRIEGGTLTWIGYPELSRCYDDFRDLFQLKKKAVSDFLRYKKSVESYCL